MSRKTEKFTYTDGQYFCNICDEPREGEELAVDCYDACLDGAKPEKRDDRMSESISLDGLEVSLFHGEDGKLVVDLATGDLEDRDVHPGGHEIPNIRIWINEQEIEIAPSGCHVVDGEEMPA